VEGLRFRPLSEVKVRVFLDRNANGKYDQGETVIPGIILRDSQGRLFSTDSEGVATVPVGLKPVLLQLSTAEMEKNLYPTTEISRVITVDSREVLFGLTPVTHIKGVVYRDSNGNGRRDQGEQTIANILIKAGSREKLTSEGGIFEFKLIPEAWTITIAPKQPYYRGSLKELRIEIRREK